MTERYTPQIVLFWVMVLLCGMFTACSFHDDNSSCPMYVQLKFIHNNMSSADSLALRNSGKVEIFVFDGRGLLVERIVEKGSSLLEPDFSKPLYIGPGTYTVMAWCGGLDAFDYMVEPVRNVRKEDIILRLNRSANGESSSELEPLWNGLPVTFTVNKTYEYNETISLLKNTNRINLSLHSDSALPSVSDIDARLTANNGSYRYDNSFAGSETVVYRPFPVAKSRAADMSFSFSTLRLVKGENVRLSVIDKTTGRSLLPESDMDVIEYLLRTLPEGISSQEYLDREDTWNIDLYLSRSDSPYITVMIKINGWTVWNQSGSL